MINVAKARDARLKPVDRRSPWNGGQFDNDAGPDSAPGPDRRPGRAAGGDRPGHLRPWQRIQPVQSRNRQVAERLADAGLATLLFDLLTVDEADDRANVFDIGLLAGRLVEAIDWARAQFALPIGLFGASTGAAAALTAAALRPDAVAAVVSRGGRPDLAGPVLAEVTAPTLLIVGGNDEPVLGLNRWARDRLGGLSRLEIVPGATHLFEEPGALEAVSDLARDWFADHLPPGRT